MADCPEAHHAGKEVGLALLEEPKVAAAVAEGLTGQEVVAHICTVTMVIR